MILVLEPEKLTARLILGVIIIVAMIGAVFAFRYWNTKITEFETQKTTISQLKYELDEQKASASKLKNELTAKESQISISTNSASQLREKNKKLETALAQCQATVNSQKSTIRTYKDYYYYYLSNGR